MTLQSVSETDASSTESKPKYKRVDLRNTTLVMCLFCSLDVCPQLLLLLPQRRLLLPPDSVTTEYHHDRFVPRLLSIRRTARRLLLLLALERTVLFAALTAFFDGRDTLGVVCLSLFARAQDVVFGYERVSRTIVSRGLFGSFESGEFPFSLGATPVFDYLFRSFDPEIVEQREIRRRQNLSRTSASVVTTTRRVALTLVVASVDIRLSCARVSLSASPSSLALSLA